MPSVWPENACVMPNSKSGVNKYVASKVPSNGFFELNQVVFRTPQVTCSWETSQPELGADRVSLRPPNRPKSGPMGFLDIPGLNSVQKSGGKGWNPANGVPFCARAYICRRSPRVAKK